MIQAEIPSAQKINLYDKLHLEDYYRTDLHWKQEKNYRRSRHACAVYGTADQYNI